MFQFAFTLHTKMWKCLVYSTIVSLQKLKTTQSLLSKIAKFTSVPMGNAPTSSNGRLWFCIHPLDFRGRRGLIPVHINIVAKNSLARPNIDKWQKCSTLTFQNSQPNHLQLRAIDKAHAIARVDLQDPPGPQDNYDILWLHRGIWWDWADELISMCRLEIVQFMGITWHYCIKRIRRNQR